jgi:hypothetical protein
VGSPIDREELDLNVKRITRHFKTLNFILLAIAVALFMIGFVRAALGLK